MDEQTERWRLILGSAADPEQSTELQGDAKGIDMALEAVYDSQRKGGLGSSTPNVNRWLGDIRRYFPTPTVQVLQRDALERLNLQRMLLEPELLEAVIPDVHLVATLLTLSKILPDKSRESARLVVRRLVEEVEKKLRLPLEQAIRASLQRQQPIRNPHFSAIDWHRTIRKNLKHYQADYQTIIPVDLIGYRKQRRRFKHIILLIDQSGSMASSVVYAGILACLMASVNSLRTHVIAFDTQVLDLSEHLSDPVDLLFATQLGGGTHIAKALRYAESLISAPSDTILLLLSDLHEGPLPHEMLHRSAQIKAMGVSFIALLALNDEGSPAYNRDIAMALAGMGIPAFASSPDAFPDLLAKMLDGKPVGADDGR